MASPATSRRRFTLILLLLLGSFVATSSWTWDRRAAWRVVRTVPGFMPSICDCYVPVPAVHCWEDGAIYFADTGETYSFPPEYRRKIGALSVPRSRAACRISTERNEAGEPLYRCWNMAAHRDVPLPPSARDWGFSVSGSLILAMDLRNGEPRHFLVIGLDGSVLCERILPALPRFAKDEDFERYAGRTYRFSGEGNFLVVHDPRDPAPTVQVLDMASEAAWSFGDSFGDITDEGVIWLIARPLMSDGGSPTFLRAVQLRTARELWRIPIPGSVQGVGSLGQDRLAVRKSDESISVFEASSGRWRFDLERAKEFCNDLGLLEVRETPHRTFLLCWGVWDFETGRLLPAQLFRFPAADFFADGRRALRPGDRTAKGLSYPEIVDIDSGKTLFRFDDSSSRQYPLNARLAGDRVLTATETGGTRVWERRHPEGWAGQILRPEVLLTVFLGAAILVLWLNRPRPQFSEER